MAAITIELPPQESQTALNLKRWEELLNDAELAKIQGRIETDRHGHIIMSPPPGANHGGFQFEIGHQLRLLLPEGRVLTECPISTADGVKAADVAWACRECLQYLSKGVLFLRCPEICVEVLSPGNTHAEIEEKKKLYFNAGAQEVWLSSGNGMISFFTPTGAINSSNICPGFPARVQLP
jgi:Uma2 family endonuclease